MKELKSLGKMLSKKEQKIILGGLAPGGGGACYFVGSDQGYSSCWYITGDKQELCHRVYGDHCLWVNEHPVDCSSNNCIMN